MSRNWSRGWRVKISSSDDKDFSLPSANHAFSLRIVRCSSVLVCRLSARVQSNKSPSSWVLFVFSRCNARKHWLKEQTSPAKFNSCLRLSKVVCSRPKIFSDSSLAHFMNNWLRDHECKTFLSQNPSISKLFRPSWQLTLQAMSSMTEFSTSEVEHDKLTS